MSKFASLKKYKISKKKEFQKISMLIYKRFVKYLFILTISGEYFIWI